MRRTIKFTKVTVTAVGIHEGAFVAEEIDEFVYHGRKKPKSVIEKQYSEKLKKMNMDSVIIKEEEIQKVFEFKLEDLIKISTEIVDECEEEEEEEN